MQDVSLYDVDMKTFRLLSVIFFALWFAGSVYAAPYPQGAYEFEDCGANCTLSGSWIVSVWGAVEYLDSSVASESVSFDVLGAYLLIYRQVYAGAGSMEVCVDASCTTFDNSNSWTDYSYPVIVSLTGSNTITITNLNNIALRLDQFIVLDAPGAGSPFPTPTPDADPYVVYAVQPECRYETLDENIVSVCYTITGGDIGIIIFLAFIASALIGLTLIIRWQQNG